MEKTRHHCVYLDLTHLGKSLVEERFPHIRKVCADFGLDLNRDPIPVRPGAHYMIGGLIVDADGRTTLPRLWAAGEVTSTGLHGANRLASNSLLEGLVYGLRCGRNAAQAALEEPDQFVPAPITPDKPIEGLSDHPETSLLHLDDLVNSLNSEMWRYVGIERNATDLHTALQQVEFWDRYVGPREFSTVRGWELQNMLLVARLMIQAAISRTESRGVHNRAEFPETDPQQAAHITQMADDCLPPYQSNPQRTFPWSGDFPH